MKSNDNIFYLLPILQTPFLLGHLIWFATDVSADVLAEKAVVGLAQVGCLDPERTQTQAAKCICLHCKMHLS